MRATSRPSALRGASRSSTRSLSRQFVTGATRTHVAHLSLHPKHLPMRRSFALTAP